MTKKLVYSSPTSVKDVFTCDQDYDDDKDLCACERADTTSDDTASLTQNTSLVSSFSNEEDSNNYSSSPRETILRHRRVRFDSPKLVDEYNSDSEECATEEKGVAWTLHRRGRQIVKFATLHKKLVLRIAIISLLSGIILNSLNSPTFMVKRWKLPTRSERRKLAQAIASLSPQDTFTLRLKGNRLDLLAASIAYHAPCPRVGEIQLDWQGTEDDPETPGILLRDSHAKVSDLGHLNTDAVLLLDEGVTLTCTELDRGFYGWKMDPRRPVGYFPLKYNGAYSILSDSALFVHRLYLDSNPPLKTEPLCEHLALSAWISALSREPPIALTSRASFSSTTLQPILDDTPAACVPKLIKAANLGSLTPEVNLFTGRAVYQ